MTDVTDADRKAAARNKERGGSIADVIAASNIRRGNCDDLPSVQSYTRHRKASIAPYVEALRKLRTVAWEMLDLINDIDECGHPVRWDNALAQIDALLENG